MSTAERPTGSAVPVAWRNALAWKWAPSMPRELKSGFLTMLYACGAMSDPAGLLRFNRASGTGRPISRKQLAGAAGCDPKDASRYLRAAEASGVLAVVGERRNGSAPLYTLCLHPFPDWGAAARSLAGSRRKRAAKKAAPWQPPRDGQEHRPAPDGERDRGGPAPLVDQSDRGGPAPSVRPQSPEQTKGDRPPTDQGGPAPYDRGGPAPPHPRETPRGVSQEMTDVGAQGADRAREHPHNGLSPGAWTDHAPTLYAFRAAARRHLEARGEAPTPQRVDAYARQLYTGSKTATAAAS